MIKAYFKLDFLGSSSPPTLASWVAGTTYACHYTQLICLIFVETESYYVAPAGLKLLDLSDPSTSASQSAGITGMSHCVQPNEFVLDAKL